MAEANNSNTNQAMEEFKNSMPTQAGSNNPLENINMEEFENNMKKMQADMEEAYRKLSDMQLSGASDDQTLKVVLSATYELIDIQFDEKALQGGMQEFQARIRQAWNTALKQVQQTTQSQTMELFKDMVPEEVRQMAEQASQEEK